MKRTEMIQILKTSYIHHMECGISCCGDDDEIYSKILHELEKEGMLPPLNEQNYHFMDNEAKRSVNEATNFYFIWEPENG